MCLECVCLWGGVGRVSFCSRSACWNAQVPPLSYLCPCKVERMVRFLAYLEDSGNISIHIKPERQLSIINN